MEQLSATLEVTCVTGGSKVSGRTDGASTQADRSV
jgi:hypothetical protein